VKVSIGELMFYGKTGTSLFFVSIFRQSKASLVLLLGAVNECFVRSCFEVKQRACGSNIAV
jgi:hypothetical protein